MFIILKVGRYSNELRRQCMSPTYCMPIIFRVFTGLLCFPYSGSGGQYLQQNSTLAK